MTVNKGQYFWLNANNELYSSDLSGQNVQLREKLSPRPSLRVLGEMHSNRDNLFFSDMATNSIMSYNITKRTEIISRYQARENVTKKTFDTVPRLDSTHQVLLVEKSRIYNFDMIDLKQSSLGTNGSMNDNDSFAEARVIDDDLTDHLRKQKYDASCRQRFLEDTVLLILVSLSILFAIIVVARRKKTKSDQQAFVIQEGS